MKTSTIVAACAAGISAAILGYAVYFDYKRRNDVEFRRKLLKEKKALLRQTKKEAKAPEEPLPIPQDETDLPMEDIMRKPGEERQKIFYQMLIKGEELLKLGPSYTQAALKYFFKSLKMVPSPTELLVAFQKTLPEAVFLSLVDLIKKEEKDRVDSYFNDLLVDNDKCGFKSVERVDLEGKKTISHALFSKKKIEAGEKILVETPILSSMISTYNPLEYCEFCQKKINEIETAIDCEKCSFARYCSNECQASAARYHEYLCPSDKTDAEALIDHPFCRLLNLSKSTNNFSSILIAKYLALLLAEEIKGRIEGSNPFIHFEHLKSVKYPADETDARELLLMRLLFGSYNAGMLEFLTLDRYSSLKSTIKYNIFGFQIRDSIKQSAEVEKEEIIESSYSEKIETQSIDTSSDTDTVHVERKTTITESVEVRVEVFRSSFSRSEISSIGLYHLLSHVSHSCDPNSELSCLVENHKLSLIAKRDIPENNEITVAFAPLNGKSSFERQTSLAKDFQMICQCDLCEAEVTAKE